MQKRACEDVTQRRAVNVHCRKIAYIYYWDRGVTIGYMNYRNNGSHAHKHNA